MLSPPASSLHLFSHHHPHLILPCLTPPRFVRPTHRIPPHPNPPNSTQLHPSHPAPSLNLQVDEYEKKVAAKALAIANATTLDKLPLGIKLILFGGMACLLISAYISMADSFMTNLAWGVVKGAEHTRMPHVPFPIPPPPPPPPPLLPTINTTHHHHHHQPPPTTSTPNPASTSIPSSPAPLFSAADFRIIEHPFEVLCFTAETPHSPDFLGLREAVLNGTHVPECWNPHVKSLGWAAYLLLAIHLLCKSVFGCWLRRLDLGKEADAALST